MDIHTTVLEDSLSPTTRLWRAQVAIKGIFEDLVTGNYVWVFVSGRRVNEDIRIPLSKLPPNIRELVIVGKIFHARVNVGAKEPKDLHFQDWEPD